MQHEFRLFGALSKVTDKPDGTIRVFGIASSGARDDAGEIITPAAMKAALPGYFALGGTGALREMHQPSAAGKVDEASVGDDGVTRIGAHVVDPVAVKKTKAGVYKGFSVGGRVLKRDPTDPTIITSIQLNEISLVDRPANPEAMVSLWKRAAEPVEREPSAADILRAAIAKARDVIDPPKADPIDALVKRLSARGVTVGEDLAKYVVGLEDQLEKAESDLSKANAELERLSKMAMPAKTAASTHATAIGKEDDSSPGSRQDPSQDDFIKYVASLSEDERTMLLMKAALRNPTPVAS